MAEKTLVDEIQAVLAHLRDKRGDFVLAMLYSEEPTAGWNFIVAAPWTEKLTLGEAVQTISQAMVERLSRKNRSLVTRLTVLPTSDPFVQAITSVFSALAGSSTQIVHSNFAGVEIPHAWILQAQRQVNRARVAAQ